MSETPKYQPTPEQIARWKEIEELEPTAFAGILTEEQQWKNVKELLDPNFFQKRLEEVRAYKEKLLKKVASAEEYEEILIEAMERRKRRKENKL
ncbi:hypothetical protein NIES4071_73400 [Calothrix sp. NIES-4071]|nr:hypothetical protein NIES4071_73400 [Calothrix sp. NIES-4071]BAZ61615.1 hypothetical protein NIES4105_73350 [Calothrix sp. NIES-4105]